MNESCFSVLIWNARNGVRSDQGWPHYRPGLDNSRAVCLDLGEMFLELEPATSGQSKIDEDFEVDLYEGAAKCQQGTPSVHGLHGELKTTKNTNF